VCPLKPKEVMLTLPRDKKQSVSSCKVSLLDIGKVCSPISLTTPQASECHVSASLSDNTGFKIEHSSSYTQKMSPGKSKLPSLESVTESKGQPDLPKNKDSFQPSLSSLSGFWRKGDCSKISSAVSSTHLISETHDTIRYSKERQADTMRYRKE